MPSLVDMQWQISIHAPVKGATYMPSLVDMQWQISIHAPVKGATGIPRRRHRDPEDFNPRTREGCDAGRGRRNGIACRISIHAPVKGATEVLPLAVCRNRISIHAPVKGATVEYIGGYLEARISIHAPVKGATFVFGSDAEIDALFQSTHP